MYNTMLACNQADQTAQQTRATVQNMLAGQNVQQNTSVFGQQSQTNVANQTNDTDGANTANTQTNTNSMNSMFEMMAKIFTMLMELLSGQKTKKGEETEGEKDKDKGKGIDLSTVDMKTVSKEEMQQAIKNIEKQLKEKGIKNFFIGTFDIQAEIARMRQETKKA